MPPETEEKKPKQARLPNVDQDVPADLEAAIEAYEEARDARMEKSQAEIQTKSKLIELMRKHKRKSISTENYDVELVVEKTTVKVRRKHREGDSE